MTSYWAERCDHADTHVALCRDTINVTPAYPNANITHLWKRIRGTISFLLTTTEVRFRYGNSCLSDLLNKARYIPFPVIREILSVGSGDGLTDYYIAYKIFGAKLVHLTDIEPANDLVETLCCADAIFRYKHAAGLMFTFPWCGAGRYEDVIKTFRGDYIIFTGEISVEGHTNPCYLLEQITEDFAEHIRVNIASWNKTSCKESLVLYKRKPSHPRNIYTDPDLLASRSGE